MCIYELGMIWLSKVRKRRKKKMKWTGEMAMKHTRVENNVENVLRAVSAFAFIVTDDSIHSERGTLTVFPIVQGERRSNEKKKKKGPSSGLEPATKK